MNILYRKKTWAIFAATFRLGVLFCYSAAESTLSKGVHAGLHEGKDRPTAFSSLLPADNMAHSYEAVVTGDSLMESASVKPLDSEMTWSEPTSVANTTRATFTGTITTEMAFDSGYYSSFKGKMRFAFSVGGTGGPSDPNFDFFGKLTLFNVKIIESPAWVLLKNPVADSPASTARGLGVPSGGSYQWSYVTKGGGHGKIALTTGDDSDTVTLRGDAWSSPTMMDDVELSVVYTVGGNTCSDKKLISVRKPTFTEMLDGGVRPDNTGRSFYHDYYHPVLDQAAQAIALEGMNVEEAVEVISGTARPDTGPGPTRNYQGFGISVKDTIGGMLLMQPFVARQSLTVVGWLTMPKYTITVQPDQAEKTVF